MGLPPLTVMVSAALVVKVPAVTVTYTIVSEDPPVAATVPVAPLLNCTTASPVVALAPRVTPASCSATIPDET